MIYVTSDLHGYSLAKLKKLLEKAQFSDEDFCFVLGDVIDRDPDGIAILKWIMLQPNVEFIMGNHEAMLLACKFLFSAVNRATSNEFNEENVEKYLNWLGNEAEPTLKSLSETEPESILAILDYLEKAPLFKKVSVNGRNFLLTHSGLANFDKDKLIDEFKVYMKETIRSNRIQEEAYYKLVYHSVITKEPSGLHEYVEKMMDNYESESSGDKYKKDLEDFYYEMLIVNAFAKQINVYPSEEQLKKLISDMAMDEECASEDIIEKYGEEYLTYIYTYDQVCAYLLENVLVDN